MSSERSITVGQVYSDEDWYGEDLTGGVVGTCTCAAIRSN